MSTSTTPEASIEDACSGSEGEVVQVVQVVDVTVVVCTYNRAQMLGDAITSLFAQVLDPAIRYGIVVVNNASKDNTADVLEQLTRTAQRPGATRSTFFRWVNESKPGVACARNRGVKEAVGTYLAFFDDDQIASPTWLAGLLTVAREFKSGTSNKSGARCVVGQNLLKTPDGVTLDLPPSCGNMLGQRTVNTSRTAYSHKADPGTGNLLLERKLFDEVGIFNEELTSGGEDLDLFKRIRQVTTIAYTPDAVIYHVIPDYRLMPAYLRWASYRFGEIIARRDLKSHGKWGVVFRTLARLGQSTLLLFPSWLWLRLKGDRWRALGQSCRLWVGQSHRRCALHLVFPRWFPQKEYFAQLDFRMERELFAQTQAKIAVPPAATSAVTPATPESSS